MPAKKKPLVHTLPPEPTRAPSAGEVEVGNLHEQKILASLKLIFGDMTGSSGAEAEKNARQFYACMKKRKCILVHYEFHPTPPAKVVNEPSSNSTKAVSKRAAKKDRRARTRD